MATFTPKLLAAGRKNSSQNPAVYAVGNLLHRFEMDPIPYGLVTNSVLDTTAPGVWNTATNMTQLQVLNTQSSPFSANVTTNAVFFRGGSTTAASFVRSRNGLDGMPVTVGQEYRGEAWVKTGAGASNNDIQLGVVWFDDTGAELSTSVLKARAGMAEQAWLGFTGTAVAPANAAFACLEIRKTSTVNAADIYFGGCAFFPTTAEAVSYTILSNMFFSASSVELISWPVEERSLLMDTNVTELGQDSGGETGKKTTSRGAQPIFFSSATNALVDLRVPIPLGALLILQGGSTISDFMISGVEVSP